MAALQRPLNRYDALKLIALAAMTLDHISLYQLPDLEWLRVLGRVAAPSFLFLVGYNGSYAFRWPLFFAALIVTLGDGLLRDVWYPQNILWTILVGRALLQWLERKPVAPLMLVVACVIWFLPIAVILECSTLGLVWMLFGRAVRREGQSRNALLYGVVGFAGATLHPIVTYDWSNAQYVAVALLNTALWTVFWHFRLQPLGFNAAPLRLLSKHALAYYVLHKLLLQGVHF